jgi:hypothetical protein
LWRNSQRPGKSSVNDKPEVFRRQSDVENRNFINSRWRKLTDISAAV